MLTSTLVHPTALKLLLPKALAQTSAKPQTTVSITADQRYYVEQQPVTLAQLEAVLKQKLGSALKPIFPFMPTRQYLRKCCRSLKHCAGK